MKSVDMDILKQAEQYVTGLYESALQKNLVYHSIDHTRRVVDHVNEIAAHYELSEKDITILNIAAWFHDTGHLFQNPAGHEDKSAEIMKSWIDSKDIYAALADEIAQTILHTKIDTAPDSLLDQIIKDADTYHFGTKDFKKIDKLMKKEMKLRNLTTIVMDWEKNTLVLLEHHQFYTEYCRNLLNARKQKNTEKLRKELNINDSINSSQTLIPEDTKKNSKDS